jgi:hypothetical protein
MLRTLRCSAPILTELDGIYSKVEHLAKRLIAQALPVFAWIPRPLE